MATAEIGGAGAGLGALALLAAAFAANYAWRALGVAIAGRLDLESPMVAWVSCVVVAMICGLTARLVIVGPGALAQTTLGERTAGVIVALVTFALLRRSVVAGTIAGVGAVATAAALPHLTGR